MSGTSPYILVVDDSLDGREMLAEYLRFRGFTIIEVSSGEAALAQAFKERPALILMDLQMPGITGWDATRQLKAHPDTREVIVVALTAHALDPDEKVARQSGCDAFVPKPFDILALGNAIAEVMQRGRPGLVALDALSRPQTPNKTKKRNPAANA